MGLRRKSREIALQFLYGHDFQELPIEPESVEQEFGRFCNSFDASEKALPYARALIKGVFAHRGEIDRLVKEHSHHWRLERMSLVDRNILRIAIFEMQYADDVPANVAINEALEIAKHYSISESVAFINGILDAIDLTSSK